MKTFKNRAIKVFLLIMMMLLIVPTAVSAAPKLNNTSISINVKKNYSLKVSGTKKKITWKSANKSVATTEKCRSYFIDDLTACMDDVNMLAFLDLIKYQMLNKENMEQLFFVTCDDRICQLLRYKLDGSNIDYRELKEEDFVS